MPKLIFDGTSYFVESDSYELDDHTEKVIQTSDDIESLQEEADILNEQC